jgi:hypothetical protein
MQELDAREERYETRLAVVEQQLARVMARLAALEQGDGSARGYGLWTRYAMTVTMMQK